MGFGGREALMWILTRRLPLILADGRAACYAWACAESCEGSRVDFQSWGEEATSIMCMSWQTDSRKGFFSRLVGDCRINLHMETPRELEARCSLEMLNSIASVPYHLFMIVLESDFKRKLCQKQHTIRFASASAISNYWNVVRYAHQACSRFRGRKF